MVLLLAISILVFDSPMVRDSDRVIFGDVLVGPVPPFRNGVVSRVREIGFANIVPRGNRTATRPQTLNSVRIT